MYQAEITFIFIKYYTKYSELTTHSLPFCQLYITHWMLCHHRKKSLTIKTLAYLTPFTAETLPTNYQHTTYSKILGISEKTRLCTHRGGTKYPLQSRGQMYFQSCPLWAPLDCTATKPGHRTSSICRWVHTGEDSGAAGFLFGEVAALFTRNPKAKCSVFPL